MTKVKLFAASAVLAAVAVVPALAADAPVYPYHRHHHHYHHAYWQLPYHISYVGLQDLQFVDDVAKICVRCLQSPYRGAKSYNIRGHVVDLATFHKALCAVEPSALKLVTFGDRQLAIAFDLDDAALQKDLGPMPRTPLEDGIRQTLEGARLSPDQTPA